jgi:hypothetical protein
MSRKDQIFANTRLFAPTIMRGLHIDSPVSNLASAADHSGSIQHSTSSFRYDSPGVGLRSTQQIPLDWSKFENHTFFNSAEAKVNSAFDKIINEFPFDGKKSEYLEFFDDLTGFEKYVYDKFPKYTGYLNFSGSLGDDSPGSDPGLEKGTSIIINDIEGSLYPTLSRDREKTGIVAPDGKSFSIELFMYVPSGTINHNEVIFQKLDASKNHGITLALSASHEKDSPEGACDLLMMVSSGSVAHLSASLSIDKGGFNHLCATWNRTSGVDQLEIFQGFELKSTSSNSYEMGVLDFSVSPILIGSGSAHAISSFHTKENQFTPTATFSGSIDELQIWHSKRTNAVQRAQAYETTYADDLLKLYLKFNEPTGSHAGGNIVLDSSGNSLHSTVTNFSEAMRLTGSATSLGSGIKSPVILEAERFSPILFPTHHRLVDLNIDLLTSASKYDANNPNLITRLIPKHYLEEATFNEGFENEDADTGNPYGSSVDFPGAGKIGSPQIIASILFTWAKLFDEIKIYIDQMGNVLNIDYVDSEGVADQFLPFVANHYGFDLPNMFADATLRQYLEGKDISLEQALSTNPLQFVQNQIWRRILSDMLEIIRTKGTLRSIRSVFLNMGLNPNSGFRFREYGGKNIRILTDAREFRQATTRMLKFSSSLEPISNPADVNAQGRHDDVPFLLTPFLSGSRTEPGKPYPAGNNSTLEVHPVTGTNNSSDGLFTSGSWTYEAFYRFGHTKQYFYPISQSLARMMSTGSYAGLNMHHVLANLVAVSGSNVLSTTSSIQFYANPSVTGSHLVSPFAGLPDNYEPSDKKIHLLLTGVNIFSGDMWHISVGRRRSDLTGSINSSSYFLRAGRAFNGKIAEYYSQEKWFNDHHSTNFFETRNADHNASGSYISIGSQSLSVATSSVGLNNVCVLGDETISSVDYGRLENASQFAGEVGHIRFWSRDVSEKEDLEHIRNFKSLGVSDPLTNFNFQKTKSGSFERLRLDISTDQPTTASNSDGAINLIDFSQNNLTGSATGFPSNTEVCVATLMSYMQLSPRIDEPITNDKIRVRGFKNRDRVLREGARFAPVTSIDPSELIEDDARFSIEVSCVQALNDDIVNILSTLDALDDIIGQPNLVFSPDYPDLENLRKIYFNRLTGKLNLKTFYDFFKWFDSSLGTLIERLVPRKTHFLGSNFVVESHMLERAKFNYSYSDMYLGANDRHSDSDTLLLRQLLVKLRKF